MRIRLILGYVEINGVYHCLGKLENERYAVGRLALGQTVAKEAQFETLKSAFEHWLLALGGMLVRPKMVIGNDL